MGNYHIKLIIFLIFVGCTNEKKELGKANNCIPEIEIERNKDTLSVGEEYRAKIYLSDDSFYFIEDNGKKEPVLPLFRINGKLVESDKKYYEYIKTIEEVPTENTVKEWTCSIIFPHPRWGEVEISTRSSYVVLGDSQD